MGSVMFIMFSLRPTIIGCSSFMGNVPLMNFVMNMSSITSSADFILPNLLLLGGTAHLEFQLRSLLTEYGFRFLSHTGTVPLLAAVDAGTEFICRDITKVNE